MDLSAGCINYIVIGHIFRFNSLSELQRVDTRLVSAPVDRKYSSDEVQVSPCIITSLYHVTEGGWCAPAEF